MGMLPALGFNPRNALLDLSPVTNAIDGNRRNALMMRESDRQDQELGLREKQVEQSMKTTAMQQEKIMAERSAGLAQMALNEKDPAKRTAIMNRVYSMHPDFTKNLSAHGVDPNDHQTVANFLVAEARGYQDPLERQKQEAQLGLIRAQTNAANQRVDQSKVMEVNGRLVRVPQSGPAEEIYNAGPDTSKLPQGYTLGPDGASLKAIPGGPADKLTESESKDALFAERMLRSERDLSSVIPTNDKGDFTKYNPTGAAQAWMPDDPKWSNLWTANMVNSKEWQQYRRAARESLSAILRKDTGAAVTDEEFNTYFPTYFPIPGDSPQVVKQKEKARNMVAQGLRGASHRAFERMYPNYDQLNGAVPAGGNAGGFKYLGTVP